MSAIMATAEKRQGLGTGPARRLRRTGRVPAVLYGQASEAVSLAMDEKVVDSLAHHAGVVNLKIDGRDDTVNIIVRDVQRSAITGRVLHIDLLEVRADQVITITVAIEPHGIPAGSAAGGQLEQAVRRLDVRCLPKDIFEQLTVDVSAMNLNDTIHVRELVLPPGVTTGANPDQAVFQVRLPKMEEPEPAAEGEVAAEAGQEPELIGKKKEDEEDEAEGAEKPEKGAKPEKAEKKEKK